MIYASAYMESMNEVLVSWSQRMLCCEEFVVLA